MYPLQIQNTVHLGPPDPIDIDPIGTITDKVPAVPGEYAATATCDSRAESPFNLTWHRRVGNFTTNAQFSETIEDSEENLYEIRARLHFNEITDKDTGEYYCEAKNVGGVEEKSITVRKTSVFTFPIFYPERK